MEAPSQAPGPLDEGGEGVDWCVGAVMRAGGGSGLLRGRALEMGRGSPGAWVCIHREEVTELDRNVWSFHFKLPCHARLRTKC